MEKRKKVLVTGAAGFLGSHLSEKLMNINCDVIGIDNLIGGDLDNLPKGIKFYQFDCCDFNKMNKAMKGVDVIYHCAATAHEGLSVFSPVAISKNNYLATASVISAGVNNKVKRIVYCSSMARYGKQGTPFTEEMEPKPVDPYGISKVAGEELLKNLCNLNKIEWVIVVPHNIIGPKQKYDDPFRNVVSIMINRILQNERPIIYGDGEQKRCFSYIDDCIYCLLALIDSDKVVNQVFNIGPDEEFTTINRVAEICSNVTGSNLKPKYFPDRPLEVKKALCSSDKAREFLNYKTSTDLYTGIKKTYEYIKEKGPKKFNYHIDLEIVNELTPKVWTEKKL
jgi:UDP-glucose 4-epimerase